MDAVIGKSSANLIFRSEMAMTQLPYLGNLGPPEYGGP
jgi:hypothetical protein